MNKIQLGTRFAFIFILIIYSDDSVMADCFDVIN